MSRWRIQNERADFAGLGAVAPKPPQASFAHREIRSVFLLVKVLAQAPDVY